jgi:hypothetical protein
MRSGWKQRAAVQRRRPTDSIPAGLSRPRRKVREVGLTSPDPSAAPVPDPSAAPVVPSGATAKEQSEPKKGPRPKPF